MTTEQWIAASSVAAVVVAAIAIVAAVIGVRDQLRTFVFVEYTGRYSKIMQELPFDARRPGSSLAALPSDQRLAALAVFREYFNMCSEEMWLKSSGRIDIGTWNVWRLGMKEVARAPASREAWGELANEYRYFDEFSRFMDSLMREVGRSEEASKLLAKPEA